MNKSLFAFLTFTAVLYGVFSEAKAEDIIRYGAVTNEIKQVELKKEDDVFDSSADIKPLTVRMSESERQQENSSDLDYIEENGISDHWWNAYWHYKAYQYHTAVGNDYNANLSYDNFNNCVERYNLEINDDLLNEWNQDIPFIDESGNLCHPYLHIKS